MRAHAVRRRWFALLAALAALVTAASVASAAYAAAPTATATPTAAVAPSFSQQVLFKAGQDAGYSCFRIPAVVRTTRGTLLAFAEGRIDNCGDATNIDIVMKRSTDGGKTWSPLQVVSRGNGDTHGNPSAIVDARTGRVILIGNANPGRTDTGECAVPCDRTVFEQYSDDDGLTWSAPKDITSETKLPEWGGWYASGPGGAIQLTKGPHAGRLLFGVNAERADGTTSVENYGALIYSDDGGDSWHIGAVESFPHPIGGTYTQKPQELSLAQLPDGSIYVAGRETSGTDVGNRDYAISRDGGQTFSQGFTTIPDLVTPIVEGSVLQLNRPGPNRLLFASPSDTDRRRYMMVRSSYDNGRTWEDAEQGTLITSDWSGYSCLVQISSPLAATTEIGLAYEGGAATATDEIRFARFNEQYLGFHNSAGPTTPDVSGHDSASHILGSAHLTAGKFGNALQLDGTSTYVRVPFNKAQLVGAGDLTLTGWFKYGASTGPQALFWLGGMNSAPQLWLRAEPSNNRLIATITTTNGTKQIASTQAYDDQQWHQVALERTGGQLLLYVDGALVASGPDEPGSISQIVAWQLEIGQRLDGIDRFDGALDDIRYYNRALSTNELNAIATSNAPDPAGLVLRLPFNTISPARPSGI